MSDPSTPQAAQYTPAPPVNEAATPLGRSELSRERQLEQQVLRLQNPPKQLNIAYILLIFFGVLGIHRFYLGRIGTGILYLFTLGLFGIGVIVDVFILRTVTESANAAEWQRQDASTPQS